MRPGESHASREHDSVTPVGLQIHLAETANVDRASDTPSCSSARLWAGRIQKGDSLDK